jgi:monoamine oxidase
MEKEKIIIVGGGAAGLVAARVLAKKNYSVTILEANNRLGGRIHTLHDPSFDQPLEKGVEFIHGHLPVTMELLQEAGIGYKPVEGKMVRMENGKWRSQGDFTIGWSELIKKMNEIGEDETVDDFLQKNFSDDKYKALRQSVCRFAYGFDLADTSKASILALRDEWMGEEDEQFRIPGGFDQLVNWMEKECIHAGSSIHTSHTVQKINWTKNKVTAVTQNGKEFSGNKMIITIPLGIWQSDPFPINFQPAIPDHINAFSKIGFGTVVKILLQFKNAFWEEDKKNMGFLFAEEVIPTWWTQLPSGSPLLTGWAGGPQAWEIENKNDDELVEIALESLSNIFKKTRDELKQLLTASLINNWKKDDHTKGGYSYNTLKSQEAKKFLNEGIEQTIFFAGEALYDGISFGTVEAALVSGKDVAEKISAV